MTEEAQGGHRDGKESANTNTRVRTGGRGGPLVLGLWLNVRPIAPRLGISNRYISWTHKRRGKAESDILLLAAVLVRETLEGSREEDRSVLSPVVWLAGSVGSIPGRIKPLTSK